MWEIDLYGIWDWLTEQDEATVAGVYAALDVLEREGPALGRPLVDTLRHTNIPSLKELRLASPGRSEVRIIFSFDPRRRAVMLLAGDKARGGKRFSWSNWYKRAIPEAERRYRAYMEQSDRG